MHCCRIGVITISKILTLEVLPPRQNIFYFQAFLQTEIYKTKKIAPKTEM